MLVAIRATGSRYNVWAAARDDAAPRDNRDAKARSMNDENCKAPPVSYTHLTLPTIYSV